MKASMCCGDFIQTMSVIGLSLRKELLYIYISVQSKIILVEGLLLNSTGSNLSTRSFQQLRNSRGNSWKRKFMLVLEIL